MGEPREAGRVLALSLYQPWATLLALGGRVKPHETRSWPTRHRGPVLIHAAKSWTAAQDREAHAARTRLALCGQPVPPEFPLGACVGVGLLSACEATDGFFKATPDHELDAAFGHWAPGRYAWRFGDAAAFAPVPAAGSQGLWAPDPGLVAACRAAAAAALDALDPAAAPLRLDRLFGPDAEVNVNG